MINLYYNSPYVCLSMFANGRSQFLLDRLGRCLKLFVLTDSTSCHEFASQFGLAIFLCEKHPKPRGNRITSACVYLNDPAIGHECQRNRQKGVLTLSLLGATDSSNLNGDGGGCVCAHAFEHVCAHPSVCACMCACMCVCVRACVRECGRACVMCLQYTIIIFYPG